MLEHRASNALKRRASNARGVTVFATDLAAQGALETSRWIGRGTRPLIRPSRSKRLTIGRCQAGRPATSGRLGKWVGG